MRTRYAPSPTGFVHIGNLRSALFEYLIARRLGGVFVLRIEDTDQERFVEGAIDTIYKTLKMVGIQHDEGPDVGGDYGPYIQSERKSGYIEYAKQLIESGSAYYCFCSKPTQNDDNEQSPSMYNRHCYELSQNEIDTNLANGKAFVIRQLIPNGKTTFVDMVYGEITVDNADLEDQVLIKSDGMPTYNFANVVDDHLMAITHVVRGSEYLPSTPKYNLLYQAFGWEIPAYVHLPLILSDKGGKLSKRRGDAFFEDFIEAGFLPQAIINFLALLGWSPQGENEIFSLKELEKIFTIEGISKSPSTLDINKLRWINGEYIKAMNSDEFYNSYGGRIAAVIKQEGLDLRPFAQKVQTRISTINEIEEVLDFVVALPEYDVELFNHKKSKSDVIIARQYLDKILPRLSEYDGSWLGSNLYGFINEAAKEFEIKSSQILWPLRCALSGKDATPGGASDLLEILGKDESLRRIKFAINKLGE